MGRFEVQARVGDSLLDVVYTDEIDIELNCYLPRLTEDIGNVMYENSVFEGFVFDPPRCEECDAHAG